MIEPGEPQWLEEDTNSVLAWIEYEDSLCGGCSQPMHESFDQDNQYAYESEHLICFACREREISKADFRAKNDNEKASAGVVFTVDKKTT